MEWTLYPFLALVLGEIALVDYREHAIYDFDTLLAFALVFAYKYLIHALGMSLLFSLLGLLIGLVIFFVSYKVYGFEAFGFGDVLLLAVMGLWFSYDFFSYFALTFMVSGFGILLLVPFLGYRKAMQIEMPLAPILVAGAFLYVLMGRPSIVLLLGKMMG